jgi:hypothetical protein
MYLIALCAAEQSCLPDTSARLWLFDDREESVYQHYHGEIKRNMAAGGIIADLEKKIAELEKLTNVDPTSLGSEPRVSWWQRLLRKT